VEGSRTFGTNGSIDSLFALGLIAKKLPPVRQVGHIKPVRPVSPTCLTDANG
jgi:hypothetical protein